MTEKKYMVISIDDPRMGNISEILKNETCKKIISYLSENIEASEKDLVDALKVPASTVEYNIKKLLQSGFIQKRKNFFWSKKGKKIVMYEISNKSILISPKNSSIEKVKSLVPGFLITVAGTFALFVYEKINSTGFSQNTQDYAAQTTQKVVAENVPQITSSIPNLINLSPLWISFLIGGILALFIFAIVNWRKL